LVAAHLCLCVVAVCLWSPHTWTAPPTHTAGPLADLWAFDPAAGAWADLSPAAGAAAPRARAFLGLAAPGGGGLYLFGGKDRAAFLGDLWRYDTAAGGWADLSAAAGGDPPPRARAYHGVAAHGGLVFVFGGWSLAGGPGPEGRGMGVWGDRGGMLGEWEGGRRVAGEMDMRGERGERRVEERKRGTGSLLCRPLLSFCVCGRVEWMGDEERGGERRASLSFLRHRSPSPPSRLLARGSSPASPHSHRVPPGDPGRSLKRSAGSERSKHPGMQGRLRAIQAR
jgi:hypothetical protein